MNWADYTILAIIAVSIAIGVWRGFFRESLSLAGWILAFVIAMTFSGHLDVLLQSHIDVPSVRLIIAFCSLFMMTLVVSGGINYLVMHVVKATGFTGTDRMLGVFFGLARGLVVVAILVILAGMTLVPQDPWWHESLFLPHFQKLAEWMLQFVPAELADGVRYDVEVSASDVIKEAVTK